MLFTRKVSEKEFEAVAIPHMHDLYRTATHLVRDATEAHDLVQNAYMQAWKSFHRFEPGTNCRAWLFKILFNEIHHYRRRWFNSKVVQEGDQPLADTVAYEPPIPEEIRDEDILAALAKVPLDFREVVLLADVQEFSYKEIASMLSIPVGTVMSRLSRGRKQLRQQLGGYASQMGIGGAEKGVQGL